LSTRAQILQDADLPIKEALLIIERPEIGIVALEMTLVARRLHDGYDDT
jgi:hypothetical protein